MSDLQKNIWGTEKYYQKISISDDFTHPGLKKIQQYLTECKNILDVGCGDGSKLATFGKGQISRTGLEISHEAIKIGKRKYPSIKFFQGVGEKLPFANDFFDAVTCLFVLEHVENPQKVIDEIIRVTEPSGIFLLLAPNFGAPNRASPNFIGSRLKKLISGFMEEFKKHSDLGWKKVTPTVNAIEAFEQDLDTTVEPYLGSLMDYLANKPVKILEHSSYWSMERKNPRLMQKIISFFGKFGLPPFDNWGPHLFLVGQKI